MAIKDPTSALFRRQGGNHLLIVGQNDEAALGVTAAAIVSLAAQFAPAADGGTRRGAGSSCSTAHPRMILKRACWAGSPRACPTRSRSAAGATRPRSSPRWPARSPCASSQTPATAPELFLFIHDLPRFRDLRRREDDFGFGRKEDELTPPDHLDMILREGPGLGVHLIAWCDTVNNLNRYFTHQQLREFEMRVLFQMSPTD